jgi:hypothetical protein
VWVRVALVGFALCLPATGCRGADGPSSKQLLADARSEEKCSEFTGDQGCAYLDRIETWIHDGSLDDKYASGAITFVQAGCVQCHAYRDIGRSQLGGSDLSAGGGREDDSLVRYLTDPAAYGNRVMGSYAFLGQERLASLAAFLATRS